MIKHIIFTDHNAAMVMCYKLAETLTLSQRRRGTLGYSAAVPHPDGSQWSVAVDDSHADVMNVVGSLPLVALDETWFPVDALPTIP